MARLGAEVRQEVGVDVGSSKYQEAVEIVRRLRATCWPPQDEIALRIWWGLYKTMIRFRKMEESAK